MENRRCGDEGIAIEVFAEESKDALKTAPNVGSCLICSSIVASVRSTFLFVYPGWPLTLLTARGQPLSSPPHRVLGAAEQPPCIIDVIHGVEFIDSPDTVLVCLSRVSRCVDGSEHQVALSPQAQSIVWSLVEVVLCFCPHILLLPLLPYIRPTPAPMVFSLPISLLRLYLLPTS